jgi:antitoxin component of MazEF toxin-antitoxin module
MPNKAERTLLRSGASVVVALPPSWLRYFGLNVGDKVDVIWNTDVTVKVKRR